MILKIDLCQRRIGSGFERCYELYEFEGFKGFEWFQGLGILRIWMNPKIRSILQDSSGFKDSSGFCIWYF